MPTPVVTDYGQATEHQRGLNAHSHDPENDLLKRYVVHVKTPSGWLGVYSVDHYIDVPTIRESYAEETRVWDNFAGAWAE